MKKILLITLVIIVTFALLFAGCSKSEEETKSEETKATTKTEEKKEEATPEVTEEPMNMDVEVLTNYNPNVETFITGQDSNNNIIIDYIREITGFNVTVNVAPKEGADQKVAAILASNDTPDLINNVITDYVKYAQMGAFTEIDTLLSEAPTLSATISDQLRKSKTIDGKLYMIPVPRNYTNVNGIYARVDWLNEYGMAVKTLDEYYNYMLWLKSEKNVIPLTGNDPMVGGFAGAFGMAAEWVAEGELLVNRAIASQTLDYLTYMNKLSSEGLFDEEFFVNTGTNVSEKLTGGIAAMAPIAWWTAKTVDLSLADLGKPDVVDYIDPPMGANGEWGWDIRGPLNSAAYIPKAAKNPVGAIKLMDFIATDEAQRVIGFGFLDEHYTEKDSVITATEKVEEIQWRIIYQWIDTQWNFDNRVKMKGYAPKYFDPTKEWAVVEPWHLYAPPIDSIADKSSELKSYMDEQFTKFIIGERPLSEYNDYVAEYKAMGGDQCATDLNAWWATFD